MLSKKLLSTLGILIAFCSFIGFGQKAFAQNKQALCGFDQIHKEQIRKNEDYKRIVEANEAAIQRYMRQNPKNGRTEATVYKIPCVVHIIHTGGAVGTVYNPTDATITTMISNMTKAFRNQAPFTSGVGTDIEIEFELAKRDPACSPTTGINRVDGSVLANYVANGVGTGGATDVSVKALSRWSNTDYYNIWVVNKIDGADGTSGTFTAGYAFFPGASATVDGTVILATQTGGTTTITHELGHALNLFHTFEGSTGAGNCPVNGDCSVDGDKVCDTAPQDDNPFQCTTNACGATTVLPNYMSYSNCAPRNYTAGQSTRMRAALETTRSGLLSSQALIAPIGTPIAACSFTGGGFGLGCAGITNVTFNTINVTSGSSSTEGSNYVDRSCLQQTTVTAGATVAMTVKVHFNEQRVKAYIDYNNNGSFTDSGEEVLNGTTTSLTLTGNVIIPMGATTSTPLRMRVISDLANIVSTCNITGVNCSGQTVAGQAEDYAVIVSPAAATPTITLSAAALTAFTSCAGTASAEQSYTVAGSNLTANISIVPPTGFEISTTTGGAFAAANPITLTQTAGTVNVTTIFVRQTSSATTGASGNITHTSTGANNPDKAIPASTVTANITPTVSITPMSAAAGSQTFTATAGNVGGGTVNYDFQKNSISQQNGASTTWNATGLVAGDVIRCVITVTGGTCLTTTTAISNTVTITAAPTITLSAAALTAFSACAGTASSTQTYTVGGTNLTADIVVTAPTGFEISSTGAAPFFASLNLSPTSGTVSTTTITVRQTSGTSNGASGNITHSSTNATTQNKAIPASTVTATSTPTVGITPIAAIVGSQTFTATANNVAGGTVAYDFQKNSISQQNGASTTWNATGLVAGDVIRCVITVTGGTCLTTTTATSNTVTITATATPTVVLSAAALTAFTSCAGTASATQTYTVAGADLTADIVVTAPTGFEISSTGAAPFFASLNLSPTSGTVSTTTITVRQTSGASDGASGDITHSSTNATTQNKAIPASTVSPLPTITGVSVANVNTASTTFNLAYIGTTGSPNQYSIVTVAPNPLGSFVAVNNSTLTASPIAVTIPVSGVGIYNFELTVRNSTTGCVSSVVPFTVSVTPTIIYVRTDGNDTNNGFTDNSAGAKLTINSAFTAVTEGGTVVLNAGTYNETATLAGKSITFQGVGNPTVQTVVMNGAGKTLTLSGNVNISEMVNVQAGDLATGGNLTLLATATQQAMLIQSAATNVNGNVNVQRYLRANTGTAGLGYRFISSPTSNATLNQLSELSPVVNANFNTAAFPGRTVPFPTVYSYDATRAGDPTKTFTSSPFPEFDKGWVSPAALTDNIGVGRGYTVNTAANQVLEITGTVNNGNVTIPIVTGNAASLGYNLVGNPYPSPIKWSLVRGLSSGVNDAIYQNMATGQYAGSWASYVSATNTGVNGATDDIAVMQGFFVIANAGGNVVMNNTVRATTYTNPSSFRTEDDKNASKNKGLLRLAMTNSAGKSDETVVYFADKATQNFDSQYDAVKFQLNGGNFPNIYTSNSKNLFSINALPNLTDDLIIPITIQSWTNGTQKIAMTEKINFTREVQVFLKDKSTDKLHDLSKGSFEFAMSAGVISDRFELIFKPQFTQSELNGDILNVYPNPTADVLAISIGDEYKGALTLRLVDVSGREIWSEKTEKSGKIYQTSTSLQNLASGTYLLEVEGSKKVVKKIVKQ